MSSGLRLLTFFSQLCYNDVSVFYFYLVFWIIEVEKYVCRVYLYLLICWFDGLFCLKKEKITNPLFSKGSVIAGAWKLHADECVLRVRSQLRLEPWGCTQISWVEVVQWPGWSPEQGHRSRTFKAEVARVTRKTGEWNGEPRRWDHWEFTKWSERGRKDFSVWVTGNHLILKNCFLELPLSNWYYFYEITFMKEKKNLKLEKKKKKTLKDLKTGMVTLKGYKSPCCPGCTSPRRRQGSRSEGSEQRVAPLHCQALPPCVLGPGGNWCFLTKADLLSLDFQISLQGTGNKI